MTPNAAEKTPYSAFHLKRGLAYFASGKAATALLGLINFTLIVRLLPVQEYAGYVSIIAAMELAIAFSTLGLDWAGVRYLPEIRESGGGGLRLLIVRLCQYRALTLAGIALPAVALVPLLIGQDQMQFLLPAARIYLCVLCVEGLLRFILGAVFDSLLLQAQGQSSLLIRNGLMAAALAFAPPGAGLLDVARYDLAAACAGLLAALALLAMHLHTIDRSQSRESAAAALPSMARMRRMALHNYLSMLLMQLYSPQVLLLLASAFLPAADIAMLGFARNLTDLIRRYQPVEMLLGLVRPLLISTYARRRDFAGLARLSQLIYKLSLLTLCPVLVAFTAYGDLLIEVAAKHKYAEAYWLVAALAWLLVSRSHRALAGTMVNVLDQPQLLTRAALANLIVLPVCVAGFAIGHGAVSLFAGACVEEVVGTWIIVRGIRALGEPYTPPWPAMVRVVMIGASLSGLLLLARFQQPPALWAALQLAAAGAISLGLLLVSGYFDAPERSRLLGLVGRTAR